MKKTILVLCAHNDDQIIGAGGALIKYAQEGYAIKSIIFSFGESSHPHLKPEVIRNIRIKESLNADKKMGGAGVAYLGIKEGKFAEEIKKKKVRSRLKELIDLEKPEKIFAHSINDRHPDHNAVAQLVESMKKDIPCPIYLYDVWTPFRLKHRYQPKLIVDISATFAKKLSAIREHRSQQVAIANLFLLLIIKAKVHGIQYGYKYAEVFDKLQ